MNARTVFALVVIGLVAVSTPAFATPQRVIVEIENVSQPDRFNRSPDFPNGKPNTAPTLYPIVVGFHDGSMDLYDFGSRATEELALLATEGLIVPIIGKLRDEHGSAVINMITNNYFGQDNSFQEESFRAREQYVDPAVHRYFSFAAKVGPSDDAFVGNDDPKMYELFDENGAYLGPLVIKVYGSSVLDAGVRENLETNLAYVVERFPDPDAGTPTDEVIGLHPGYNGSVTNPEGQPVGILGVPSEQCESLGSHPLCIHIDPVEGDFKRPGHLLAVIRVTAGIDGSYAGAWYDPNRSGEGFEVTVFESAAEKGMAVTWYTYAPDGSGEQLYLFGSGPVDHQFAEIEMFRSRGGRFASLDNPEDVSVEPWGTIRLGFGTCNEGRVFYEPNDAAFAAGDYFLFRLVPVPVGLGEACGAESLGLIDPPDDEWPLAIGDDSEVEPDPGPQPDP